MTMTQIQQLQSQIMAVLEARGWEKLNPASISKSICLESAELLENFQWKEHTVDQIKSNPALITSITQETSDVMIYCLQMTIALDIDAAQAIQDKLNLAAKKYPIDKVKDNPDGYHKLKKEARESV